jgi:hypothetical protein
MLTNVKSYIIKYSARSEAGPLMIPKKKIDSTMKWVEYSLDIHDMSKLLISTKNLTDKYALMDALDIAERKKKWHYRQDNFNLNRAGELLQAIIKING